MTPPRNAAPAKNAKNAAAPTNTKSAFQRTELTATAKQTTPAQNAAETAPPAPSVESAEAATADPPHQVDDDNPFLAIVEELEAAQNGQGANGASAPPTEPATGASVESAANIEAPADDEADTGRTVATDA